MSDSLASEIRAATDDIAAHLADVPDLGKRVHREPGEALNVTPCLVLGPPQIAFDAFGIGGPTDATFLVYIVADAAAGALAVLTDLLPVVCEALDGSSGVVRRADPDTYLSGTVALPCYAITVEYPL
jgi:hypothetical protein